MAAIPARTTALHHLGYACKWHKSRDVIDEARRMLAVATFSERITRLSNGRPEMTPEEWAEIVTVFFGGTPGRKDFPTDHSSAP